jgi:hypothetical protein
VQKGMSALPPKADMCGAQAHVRLVPITDIGPIFKLMGAPSWGARVVVLRAVGYWLGCTGAFLSCSMT